MLLFNYYRYFWRNQLERNTILLQPLTISRWGAGSEAQGSKVKEAGLGI
jgi:hypothetical protein